MTTNVQSQIAQLLGQELLRIRSRNPRFSLRSFANRLGIPVSALSEVMAGHRLVTAKMAAKLVAGLALDPRAAAELVQGCQKSKKPSKNHPTESTPTPRSFLQVEMDQFHILADWFYFAVLSMAELEDFQENPRFIASRLGISERQASQAVQRLERAGFLLRAADGQLRPTEQQLTTSTDIVNLSVRKGHYQNLELARESLDRHPVELRDFSEITMAIDPARLPEAKAMIRDFRRELCARLEAGPKKEVYRLCLQMFPLTQKKSIETKPTKNESEKITMNKSVKREELKEELKNEKATELKKGSQMKKEINKTTGILAGVVMALVSLWSAVPSVSAGDGHERGNGGGAWVCRNSADHMVRWAVLVDLYEARTEFGLTVPKSNESVETQRTRAAMNIFRASADFYALYDQAEKAVLGSIIEVENANLEIIEDSLYRVKPDRSTCSGGVIAYEQVANYTNYGKVLIDKGLFSALSTTDQAALYTHEAVYKVLREQSDAQNSVSTRKLVGLVYSTKPVSEYAEQFRGYDGTFELLPVQVGGKWGYVNKKGEMVINPLYDGAGSFSKGLAPASLGEKWGLIDQTGRWVVNPTYDSYEAALAFRPAGK